MSKLFNKNINVTRQKIEESSLSSKIYFGVDSERINIEGTWFVDYLICVVLHEDGCHGASVIYGDVIRERDFDKNLSRPRNRLFSEVLKLSDVYAQLQYDLGERDTEIHLDLNPDELYGSSCVINEANGYIKGLFGVTPKTKPDSWAASICADRLRHID